MKIQKFRYANPLLVYIGLSKDTMSGVVPIAAGFGISRPEHVKQIIETGADGAIVGSAFVKIIEENTSNAIRTATKLAKLAKAMKEPR